MRWSKEDCPFCNPKEKCPKCGKMVSINDNFCSFCKADLTAERKKKNKKNPPKLEKTCPDHPDIRFTKESENTYCPLCGKELVVAEEIVFHCNTGCPVHDQCK